MFPLTPTTDKKAVA